MSIAAATLTVTMTLNGHAEPQIIDFGLSFLVVALISLIATPLSFTMPRDAADDVTGHRERR